MCDEEPEDKTGKAVVHFDLGGISKPATVLIEKISDAIGWYLEAKQIVRVADAE